MLVSIAIDPRCFGVDVIDDLESKRAAEGILNALRGNAVALCDIDRDWLNALKSQIIDLNIANTGLGQSVQIRFEELLKQQRLSIVPVGRRITGSKIHRLRRISKLLRADIVICASSAEVDELSDLVDDGIEVCSLNHYARSNTEYRRQVWSEPADLNNMKSVLAESIVGRAVKYSDEIIIYDPFIGKLAATARSGQPRNLRKFAQAVVFVAQQWFDVSPYSRGDGVKIKIVTRAGWIPASPHIAPDNAHSRLETALRNCDTDGFIKELDLIFKQDDKQPRFRSRYIKAGQHCWKIDHEIRDLILVKSPRGERGDVSVTQDCQTFRSFVRGIEELPDL